MMVKFKKNHPFLNFKGESPQVQEWFATLSKLPLACERVFDADELSIL